MRFDRLLLASAACALAAGVASAQTAASTAASTPASTPARAGAAGRPGSTSAATGGVAGSMSQPGAASGTSAGNMTGLASQPDTAGAPNTMGNMSGATGQTGDAATPASSGGAFQPITPAAGADLLAVLQSSGQFTTLVKAVTATNLASVLQRPGSLTIFAPTDAAFAALPAGQLATLMQPANATQLQQFVLLHAVNTPIKSSELVGHSAINVPTVATGKSVRLDGSSGAVKIDDVTVLQADVKASNGTIFVIDKALSPAYVPPAIKAAAAATATESTTTTSKTTKHKKR